MSAKIPGGKPTDDTKKKPAERRRNRTNYRCSKCGQPKRGHVCPFCANKKVSVTNSLATVFPELSKEWHSVLNEGLQPEDVAFTANLDVLTTRHTFCF